MRTETAIDELVENLLLASGEVDDDGEHASTSPGLLDGDVEDEAYGLTDLNDGGLGLT